MLYNKDKCIVAVTNRLHRLEAQQKVAFEQIIDEMMEDKKKVFDNSWLGRIIGSTAWVPKFKNREQAVAAFYAGENSWRKEVSIVVKGYFNTQKIVHELRNMLMAVVKSANVEYVDLSIEEFTMIGDYYEK